jgi:LTXXQ motif family protein
MRAAFDAKTPVERLEAHLAAMESRTKVLKDVKPALARLYEALSADQKKKADDILTGMGCMM